MRNALTIKDIAEQAGVSISTVSRVLNQSAPVREEVKQRVMNVIQETGFAPNMIARSLKRNVSAFVAFVISDSANPFFSGISRGIEDVLYTNGYNLIVCSTDGSPEREADILALLISRQIDGIIINTSGFNDELICEISQSVPMILSNRYISTGGFVGDFVDFDNVGGVGCMTDHLISLGHERIAIINGPLYLSTAAERERGFRRSMMGSSIKIRDEYVINAERSFTMNDGYQGASKLFALPKPPTAIIAANNETVLGCLRFCKERHLRIPEDVSICCFGETANDDLLYITLTHAHTNLYAAGNRMAELMIDRIGRKEGTNCNREIRFDSHLIVEGSTAPPYERG